MMWPGFPRCALRNWSIQQTKYFRPEICLDERVLQVEKKEDGFELVTDRQTHFTKTIVITAGVGAFEPRTLIVSGAERFEGQNLHYFVEDVQQFAGKRVLVAGGGDSAVDWANTLERIASQVTLIHRRDRFRAHESSVEQLKQSSVQVITPRQIQSLHGEKKIEQAVLVDPNTKETESIDVDEVIVSYGFVSSLGPIKEWGLEIEKGSIVVNSRMETNIPGIYAAGDVTTYDGKVKLIAVGFGEAPTAVNNAVQHLNPRLRLQPAHSSHMSF